MRVCEELGVGRGDPDGERLGAGIQPGSLAPSEFIGGKTGENTEDGRVDGGKR